MTTPGLGHNGGVGPEDFTALEGLTLSDLLQRGLIALLRSLVQKVESGEASPSEQANLRNLLRDNGMVHAPVPGQGALSQPAQADLPRFENPEYDE